MKNKFVLLTSLAIILVAVLGCSMFNPFSDSSETPKTGDSKTTESDDRTTTDKIVDEVIVEKTGVEECDELTAYIANISRTEEDNFVSKTIKEQFLNQIRKSLRESVEQNKNKPEELAKKCKEIKTQLETYKQREDEQKENQQ